MLKTNKNPIIDRLILKGKLSEKQGKAAYIIQHIYRKNSCVGSRVDSLERVYVDGSKGYAGLEMQLDQPRFWQDAQDVQKKWEYQIKLGDIDPLTLQIVKSILHYNIYPKDIAQEFTQQLYQKPAGHLMARFNIKVSTYKIEVILKQGLDLFIKLGEITLFSSS